MVVQQLSINSGLVCPRASLRSDRVNRALDSVVFHMCHWTDRGVFHASGENTDKCRGIVWCSVDGERGVLVELSKYHSLAVPLPPMIVFLFAVVDGIVKISRMRILRNCPYRGTLGAFGACTASRTSHSPSSLRACHLETTWRHGTVRCFSSCTWVDVMHCVSFRPRVASSQSFRHDDIVLAFCAFWFSVVSSASGCVFVLSECCHRCNDKGAGRACGLSQLRLVSISEGTRTPLWHVPV